jgi:hypothetical protein
MALIRIVAAVRGRVPRVLLLALARQPLTRKQLRPMAAQARPRLSEVGASLLVHRKQRVPRRVPLLLDDVREGLEIVERAIRTVVEQLVVDLPDVREDRDGTGGRRVEVSERALDVDSHAVTYVELKY